MVSTYNSARHQQRYTLLLKFIAAYTVDFIPQILSRLFSKMQKLKLQIGQQNSRETHLLNFCIGDSTGDLLLVLPGADDRLDRDVETTNED